MGAVKCLLNILVQPFLIRERNQKLIILIDTLTIDQLSNSIGFPVRAQPVCRQNRNISSIILTFSPVMYSFYDKIFEVFFPLMTAFFRKLYVGGS